MKDEASERDDQLARLLAQMTDDAQGGLPVDLDRVCREHPTLSDELRELCDDVWLGLPRRKVIEGYR